MISDHDREERLARRVEERKSIFARTVLEQLAAGVPIVYKENGVNIEECPDGSRYVIEFLDGGRSTKRLREFVL